MNSQTGHKYILPTKELWEVFQLVCDGSIPIVQIHFLVGQAGKPVKAKGRAGCPPHNELFLQKWDAPVRSHFVEKPVTNLLVKRFALLGLPI
jgi:hypothetical protein